MNIMVVHRNIMVVNMNIMVVHMNIMAVHMNIMVVPTVVYTNIIIESLVQSNLVPLSSG